MKRLRIRLAKLFAPKGWEFDLTTHPGFISPCDCACCFDVRVAYRSGS